MVAQEQLQAILPTNAHEALVRPVEVDHKLQDKKGLAQAAAALLYVTHAIAQAKDSALLKVAPEGSKAPSSAPQPVLPPLSPQIKKDLEAYMEAMELLQEDRAKLKEMAKQLSHMKNVMYGVVEIMNMFQNVEGAKVRSLSAVDNIDSDIRSQVTEGQGSINSITSGKGTGHDGLTPTLKQKLEALRLVLFVKQMQAFIDAHGGAKGLVGKSALAQMQDAINKIKGAFGKDWGNPKDMAALLLSWVHDSHSGTAVPQMKDLQFGFEELNQQVSALSTVTNTNLQFTSEMFKNFLGIDETAMQTYQKFNLQMVQNQKSN
ncbi:MAG: hypothetical protein P0S96_01930 [Simkaniaceae bacterium]|nr:hypothetical protein [Candidatus Sacchlamyda saccharinae]